MSKDKLLSELNQLRERNSELEAREAEQRLARQALENSEMLLRKAFDTIPDLVAIIDRDHRILISNWRGGYEYVPEVVRCGNPVCHEVYYGSRSACEPCPVSQVFRTGRPVSWEKTNPHIGQVEIRAFPIFDESGKVVLVVDHIRDITSRKQAEEELKNANLQAERLLKFNDALLSAIPTPVFYKDRQGRYLGCNRAFTAMMGVTSDEMRGKTAVDLWPGELAEVYHEKDIELMENPVRQVYEFKVRDKEGIERAVMYAKDVFRDETGQVNGIVGAFLDISELKEAEEQLKESEKRFRTIFDNNSDGLIVADIASRDFVLVNPMICRMLGYQEEELKKLKVMDIHPDQDQQQVVDHFEKQARGELKITEKTPVKRKDGTLFFADINTSPLTLDGKAVLLGAFRDVTERIDAEESVRRLNQELERKVEERTSQLLEAQDELLRREKLAILGQLSGSVGHELRNPLGVMSNAVYFLKMVLGDTNGAASEYLDIIKHEIDISTRIISDLLDFARSSPPRQIAVSVPELIEESLARCSYPDTVDLRCHIPEALPLLRVDPLQMRQVIQNLIANAVQAMPDGGALQVAARLVPAPAALIEISVEDTGEGISQENLKKLFQPLFTTRAKGIGLGLTICRNLTESNGGRIEVESEIGKGTRFALLLPMEE
jgi:PAS domain S-box-containing protein